MQLVQVAGAAAGGFEVGGDAVVVEVVVAGVQQCGADAVALAAGSNGEDREVLVRRAGRVVFFQGATPASTNDSTAGTPSRSRASADDTRPGRAACCAGDTDNTP